MRSTRQRTAISRLLGKGDAFRSAQDIHEQLRTGGERVGLTTVYRTLQALADAGEVDVLRKEDGEAIYRRCSSGAHHHHLVCTSCGTSVEIESSEVEDWAIRSAHRHGFELKAHDAEVYGLCSTCRPTG